MFIIRIAATSVRNEKPNSYLDKDERQKKSKGIYERCLESKGSNPPSPHGS